MIVVDSSVLVSHFGRDKHTENSITFFEKLKTGTESILLPTLVVMEVLTTLKRLGHVDLSAVTTSLSLFDTIPLDAEFVAQYTKFIQEKTIMLKTSDAIVAAAAKLHRTVLITWDKKLLSPANTFCRTITPTDYIKQHV